MASCGYEPTGATRRRDCGRRAASGLLEALRARETQRATLDTERAALHSTRHLKSSEADGLRDELLTMADDWRHVLAHDPTNARPIVSTLLVGRAISSPSWRVTDGLCAARGH